MTTQMVSEPIPISLVVHAVYCPRRAERASIGRSTYVRSAWGCLGAATSSKVWTMAH